jgi:TP901 family phage tail tape measure protein
VSLAGGGLNLVGNIDLNAAPAIKAAESLGQRFNKLSQNSRTTTGVLKGTAAAMTQAAKAADTERKSLNALAMAQARINKINRESIAGANLTKAKTAGVISNTAGKSAIAEGQAQLIQNRVLSESIRQRIALEDAEGRAAVRNAQIATAANRARIANERMALAQSRASGAANARTVISAERAATAIGHIGTNALHVGVVTGAIFVGLAANAVIMERQFANVIRTSDILDRGLSKVAQTKAIDSLRLQFDALAQSLPLSYKELTEIGAAANQLGVTSNHLAEFTKVVAQFSATTGVSVDTASTAFGRLDSLIVNISRNGQLIGGVNHDYQGLADAINKVGVNSVATDQQIINVASQISGIANAAGLGYKEVIGFSGALASVNISPYLARGMTTRLFSHITNAVAEGGTELQKFATVAGVSAKDFAQAWSTDPSKAIEYLFDGIRQSGPNAVNVLKSLGVNSVLDQPALVRLANAADKFGKSADGASRSGGIMRQTFDDAATAAGENARQYAVISHTVQSRLQLALNRVQILFRDIGNSNLGPLGDSIDNISNSVLKLTQGLDKPFKLLGAIQLPFSNADVLGFASLATGAVAAFTLLVGIVSKVVAAFLRVREGAAVVASMMGRAGLSIRGYAVGAGEAAAANEVLAASNRAVALSSVGAARAFNNLGSAGTKISGLTPTLQRLHGGLDTVAVSTGKVTAATSMFAAKSGNVFTRAFSTIGSSVDGALYKMQNLGNSSNRIVRAIAPIGTAGAAAFTKVSSAATKLGSTLGRVGGGHWKSYRWSAWGSSSPWRCHRCYAEP